MRVTPFLLSLAVFSAPPALAQSAPLSPEAAKIIAAIDARHGEIAGLASKIWEYAEVGYKGASVAAKTLTLAAVELYQNPDLRTAARAELAAARGPKYKYKSLLGDRKPPLDFRD